MQKMIRTLSESKINSIRSRYSGRKICKYFAGHGIFMGQIRCVWVRENGCKVAFVEYTDGDTEDIDLKAALVMPARPRLHHTRKQRNPRCATV